MEVGQGDYGLLIALKSEMGCFAIQKIDKDPRDIRQKYPVQTSQLYYGSTVPETTPLKTYMEPENCCKGKLSEPNLCDFGFQPFVLKQGSL